MKKCRARSDQKAKLFTQANKIADRGSYAAKLEKYRDAVLLLLEGEKLKLPPGSKPLKKLIKLREVLEAAYKEAVPVIDSMINKGIVNKNKAARHKSRLNTRIKALSA